MVTDAHLIEQNVDIGSSRLLDFAKYTRNSVELADIGGSDANTRGLEFHPDGTRLYVVTRTNKLVSQYDLRRPWAIGSARFSRSEEHTSELQSRGHLVCRLLLEEKKQA